MSREFGPNVGLNAIRKRFNIVLGSTGVGDIPYTKVIGSRYIQIQKIGMLTDTPWPIGTIGTILTVPFTHQTDQFTYGDIWMTFDESRLQDNIGDQNIPSQYKYNFYLTSYNNTAMIQTGHSNGDATSDEQKVLANTLFYLKQLTRLRFTIDNSARDIAAPNPVTQGYFTNSFVFTNPGDNGSVYQYYVENMTIKQKSDVMSARITTGVKGYAYVIDENPTNTNVPTTIMTTGNSIYLEGIPNVNGKWLHIRSIDGAGNCSTVTHFQINLGHADLSLRQFINSIERDGKVQVVNRMPQIDATPIRTGSTTANYYHVKDAVGVKRGDIITYTIRIYNEGIFRAYADEVNIYLPEGLEFISSNINKAYGWGLRGENQIASNYLIGSGIEGYIYYDAYGNKQYKPNIPYVDLKLELRVGNNLLPNTILTSIAQINRYHAVDSNGRTLTNTQDKDSTPGNANIPTNAQKPNYLGKNGNYVGMSYYPGQEDDDDFEKVQIIYTDISGKVTKDTANNKQKAENMTVKLKDPSDGTEETTQTNSNGDYVFKDKNVNKNYILEFEYDGQTYTKSGYTWSYAEEDPWERQAVNDRFYEITKDGGRNRQNSNQTVTFNYNTRSGISETDRYVAPFNKGKDQNGTTVFANMSAASYDPTRMHARTGELSASSVLYNESIEFAIIERDQINLEITSDLANVITTIKGQDQTYNYGARETVKNNNYYNVSYNQEIYPSDYAYRKDMYKGQNLQNIEELEIYATYYIRIRNNSTSNVRITELLNYYTPEYSQIIASAYSYGSASGNVIWNTNSKYSQAAGYQNNVAVYTNSLEGIAIAPQTEMYVFIRYIVGKDANRNIYLGNKQIASEIYSYSSEEGLIDIASKPNNVSNGEKDSDISPILSLNLNNKTRYMTGKVWEEQVNAVINGVKTGDGIYREEESKINNIKIELIEKLKNESGQEIEYPIAAIYSGADRYAYINNNGQTEVKEINAIEGGYYFNEIIPGNYIIRFTYGDTEASLYYNGQDYKSTITRGITVENASDATDNKPRRKELIDQSKTINYEIGSILANPETNIERYKKLASMFADTPNLWVNIEYDNNQTGSLDLGLVRRPQTKIELTKEIVNIELVNDGVTLIDLKNGIENNSVLKMKDLNKDIYRNFVIYMDDELLQGAELNITYKIVAANVGEKDNLANYFEYDMEYGTKEEQDEAFKTGIDTVYDYVKNIAFTKEKNPQWEIVTDYSKLPEGTQNYIRSNDITVIETKALDKKIAPGETSEVEVVLSKVLGISKKDNQEYLNEAEIIEMTNQGGRKDEEATPGNHVPKGEGTEERDEWDTQLLITRPTGAIKTKLYYILGISLGGVLILGIVLIKKYVLGSKY